MQTQDFLQQCLLLRTTALVVGQACADFPLLQAQALELAVGSQALLFQVGQFRQPGRLLLQGVQLCAGGLLQRLGFGQRLLQGGQLALQAGVLLGIQQGGLVGRQVGKFAGGQGVLPGLFSLLRGLLLGTLLAVQGVLAAQLLLLLGLQALQGLFMFGQAEALCRDARLIQRGLLLRSGQGLPARLPVGLLAGRLLADLLLFEQFAV